jgi:hypothetical protein
MIRIAISPEVYAAILKSMPLGTVGVDKLDEQGRHLIWLDPRVVAKLRALRGPGEDFSAVIIRLAVEA